MRMLRVTTVITGYDGAPCYNNLFYGLDNRPQDALNHTRAVWEGLVTVMGVNARVNIDPVMAVIDPATGVITGTATGDPGDEMVGTYAGDILPPATQGLLQIRTGSYVGGRELRGRLYVPYMPEGTADNGKPNAGALAVLQYSAGQLAGDAATTNKVQVWSRKNGVIRPVSDVTVWSQFAVLRSRRD